MSKALNATMGKQYEYMGVTHRFSSWDLVEGTYMIQTNHSVLSVEKDRLELFLNSLIETESVSIVPAQSRMSLQAISPEINQMLVQSMTDMIRDLSAAKTSEEINNTSRKAQAMTGMVNAFVGVAKLEIETIKITRKK